MASISNIQDNIYNPILKETTKGFAELDKIKSLSYSDGYVMKGMEYRPDLVADYYLGDSSLSWLITCYNNFTNGLKDYTLGKKLKIPRV